jgi:hypothetical protein
MATPFTLTAGQIRKLRLPAESTQTKPTKAKKPEQTEPKEITHWTRDNLKDWNGTNDWRVGIARQLREGAMIDLVVAWQGNVPKTHELVVWSEFVKWTIEETEARLKTLEVSYEKAIT